MIPNGIEVEYIYWQCVCMCMAQYAELSHKNRYYFHLFMTDSECSLIGMLSEMTWNFVLSPISDIIIIYLFLCVFCVQGQNQNHSIIHTNHVPVET